MKATTVQTCAPEHSSMTNAVLVLGTHEDNSVPRKVSNAKYAPKLIELPGSSSSAPTVSAAGHDENTGVMVRQVSGGYGPSVTSQFWCPPWASHPVPNTSHPAHSNVLFEDQECQMMLTHLDTTIEGRWLTPPSSADLHAGGTTILVRWAP